MNAEQARAKIAANKADPVSRLDVKGRVDVEKTIAFWEDALAQHLEYGVEYKTPSWHASAWLGDTTLRYRGLGEAVELAVQHHFQKRGIAFVQTRGHLAHCDCDCVSGCTTFYHLDVSPNSLFV
jgi:hypothetical protein